MLLRRMFLFSDHSCGLINQQFLEPLPSVLLDGLPDLLENFQEAGAVSPSCIVRSGKTLVARYLIILKKGD